MRFILQAQTDLDTAAMGGTYEFTRLASANLREKDDSYNSAIAGFLAGSVLGIPREWSSQCLGSSY
jgi:hypothetical protein